MEAKACMTALPACHSEQSEESAVALTVARWGERCSCRDSRPRLSGGPGVSGRGLGGEPTECSCRNTSAVCKSVPTGTLPCTKVYVRFGQSSRKLPGVCHLQAAEISAACVRRDNNGRPGAKIGGRSVIGPLRFCSPEGAADDSPGRKSWVSPQKEEPSLVGEPENVCAPMAYGRRVDGVSN